jgi:hypothetical protein
MYVRNFILDFNTLNMDCLVLSDRLHKLLQISTPTIIL